MNRNLLLRWRSHTATGICLAMLAGGWGADTGMLHAQDTVARQWNEALLDAIRIDFPAPTVHARNLYHVSAAMYDAWAAYDGTATGHFYTDKHAAGNLSSDRNEAVSYAAYRVLSDRYQLAVDPVASQARFDGVMSDLGYDTNLTSTVGDTPWAIGNRIAQTILQGTLSDGSNEANAYADPTGYSAVNSPMIVDHPSLTGPSGPPLADVNRWQPLFIESLTLQNDLTIGEDLQEYVGPHWGDVTTFALGLHTPPGPHSWSSIDPGPPPQFGGAGHAEFRDRVKLLIEYSNGLDPNSGPGAELINISPNTSGNRPLGTHVDQGYGMNPVTGQPYPDNLVKRADYGRVLAEFWADGPTSETPPGHWNVIANEISDHSQLAKRLNGNGPTLDDLEWDVKLYFALNGAAHDAAVAAWGSKREYDYSRPITQIRYLGSLGQSSDPQQPSFHADGLPLEPDLIELITASSIQTGGRHRNVYVNANQDGDGEFVARFSEQELVGKLAIRTWNHEPADPETQVSGVDWILAENWVPYQKDNFVTPAFAAYVSGHSTFSRAAAEVLSFFTGSEYFPGGLGEMTFGTDFLDFEVGPSSSVTLQWAKFADAADEAGISRLWGGIHVPADDFAGRIMGAGIGIDAYLQAVQHFGNVSSPGDFDFSGTLAARDIDLLLRAIRQGSADPTFDLNNSSVVDGTDTTLLVEFIFGTHYGDANLDGSVTASGDGAILLANLGGPQAVKGWADGDFDGDATLTASGDGAILLANLGSDQAAVPEPSTLLICWAAALGLVPFAWRSGSPQRAC